MVANDATPLLDWLGHFAITARVSAFKLALANIKAQSGIVGIPNDTLAHEVMHLRVYQVFHIQAPIPR